MVEHRLRDTTESSRNAGENSDASRGETLQILQCAREIRPGGGVCGVAYDLEKEFFRLGTRVDRLTLESLGYGSGSTPNTGSLLVRKALLLRDVVFFSIVGTLALRARQVSRKEVITITHGDAVAGDIYVNHGLHRAMLFRSGRSLRMLLRNPLHVFLLVREWVRFRLPVHRRIVCFSRSERALLLKHYPHLRAAVEIIPNGVDIERFSPDPNVRASTRSSLMISDRDFILIFVGHEFDRKGLGILIDALALLPPSVKLLVVGNSPEHSMRRYRDMSYRNGTDHRVSFLGGRADVAALMNAADIFALPTEFESWALVGLEAMACGVPVLAPPVGGIPDYLHDGKNGLTIDRNAENVAAKVRALMSDPEVMAKMRRCARETAVKFSWSSIAKQYLRLARQIRTEKMQAWPSDDADPR